MCPDIWNPVCGCDNQTYSNNCDRLAAGVAFQHNGACATVVVDGGVQDAGQLCGPFFPGGQCPSGMTCNIQSCSLGATGTCVWTPQSCPYLWDPVCGCDDKTYANDCIRLKAGVGLKHQGECMVVPPDAGLADASLLCGPVFPGGQCPWGMSCDIQSCLPGATGTCVWTPTACPKLWAPVCGCDGQTYANDCYRVVAGVALMHTGTCTPVPDAGPVDGPWTDGVAQLCGPFPGGQCSPGEVCDIHSCLFGASGTCVPKPVNCPFLWAPVCGCNDLTYANDCIRLMAGVPLKHNGECYPTVVDGGIIISDF
jgi:hypothetical protein